MRLNVHCKGFWPGFIMEDSIFDVALRSNYNVSYVDETKADLIFSSHFVPVSRLDKILRKKANLTAKQVLFSGEPFELEVGKYHGVISYHTAFTDNHFRLPLWMLYCKIWENVICPVPVQEKAFSIEQLTTPFLRKSSKFACAIYSNKQILRSKAIQSLNRMGGVDVFGRSHNRPVNDKIAVMKDYQFNVCFENTVIPGYITEKALQAKMAGCVPLWFGDPNYTIDFNEGSLVNMLDYNMNFEKVFDELDFDRIATIPLLDEAPLNYLQDLGDFFKSTIEEENGFF